MINVYFACVIFPPRRYFVLKNVLSGAGARFGQKNLVKKRKKGALFSVDPIYVLRKRATGAVSSETGRYIGVTSELPEQRLREHCWEANTSLDRSHRLNWLRTLEESPIVEVIEWVLPMHRVEREKYWIALFRDYGHNLVNATDGGEGTIGFRHAPETRKRMGDMQRGKKRKPRTPEQNAAQSARQLGKTPVAAVAKSAALRKGKPLPEKHRQAISEALVDKKKPARSASHCAALSDSLSGRRLSQKTIEKVVLATTGRKRKNASSVYHGVYWCKRRNKWLATTRLGGRTKYLGEFILETEAARAVDAYVRANNLSPNLLNFP